MPAIDPERLRREAGEIAQLIGTPTRMLDAIDELMSFYADRTRRPPRSTRAEDAVRKYGTPAPISRSLLRALEAELTRVEGQREEVMQALWDHGHRETRLLAAELLAGWSWERAQQRGEALLAESRDAEVHRRIVRALLRTTGGRKWSALEPALRRWLRSKEVHLQRAALWTVAGLVKTAPAATLRQYLELFAGLAPKLSRGTQSAAHEAYRAIIDRHPAEAAQFLIDEVHRHPRTPDYRSFLEAVEDGFPEPQRAEVRRVLSRT